jgi:hypothetical protein
VWLRQEFADLDAGEITVHDSRVVGGQARHKAGGKTENAVKTIAIDRSTVTALGVWQRVQDTERPFYESDCHPGGYGFTYQDGRPPHPDTVRNRFDRWAADQAAPLLFGPDWDGGSQDGQDPSRPQIHSQGQ